MFIFSIKGHQEYIYNGDRTKEELLNFSLRLSGPPVKQVTRMESVDMLKTTNQIFFTFVGKQDGILWDIYHSVAEHYQPHGFFYATTADIAVNHFEIIHTPTILVWKENKHFHFSTSTVDDDDDDGVVDANNLNQTLHQWVNEERFLAFPKVKIM